MIPANTLSKAEKTLQDPNATLFLHIMFALRQKEKHTRSIYGGRIPTHLLN